MARQQPTIYFGYTIYPVRLIAHSSTHFRIFMKALTFGCGFTLGVLNPSAQAADRMPNAQRNALVKKYCTGCHTDSGKSGAMEAVYLYRRKQPATLFWARWPAKRSAQIGGT
jgi:hypothetical protein